MPITALRNGINCWAGYMTVVLAALLRGQSREQALAYNPSLANNVLHISLACVTLLD